MNKIIALLKFIFHASILLLIILSLFPGSLLGLLFYGDLAQQPYLLKNPFGTTINHFFSYASVSLLGLILYSRSKYFQKLFYAMLVLSTTLEVLQAVVPNRAFELDDLMANILGVLFAYSVVKIYLFFKKL